MEFQTSLAGGVYSPLSPWWCLAGGKRCLPTSSARTYLCSPRAKRRFPCSSRICLDSCKDVTTPRICRIFRTISQLGSSGQHIWRDLQAKCLKGFFDQWFWQDLCGHESRWDVTSKCSISPLQISVSSSGLFSLLGQCFHPEIQKLKNKL